MTVAGSDPMSRSRLPMWPAHCRPKARGCCRRRSPPRESRVHKALRGRLFVRTSTSGLTSSTFRRLAQRSRFCSSLARRVDAKNLRTKGHGENDVCGLTAARQTVNPRGRSRHPTSAASRSAIAWRTSETRIDFFANRPLKAPSKDRSQCNCKMHEML